MKLQKILLASAALFFCAASLSATSTHTWVSGTGNDTNSCSFSSPCLTFAGALANTSAGGIITAMDAGDFGSVSITQSVTIDGNNLGSITFSSGNGINITGAIVTLQNLTINGIGTGSEGININGGTVTVDNCEIMNFTSLGINITGAVNLTVENSRIEGFTGTDEAGIQSLSNGAENIVVRNSVIDASPLSNSSYGLYFPIGTGPVKASLQNVTIMGAGSVGIVSYSGATQITGSVITKNNTGVQANSGSTISVASSMITANNTGVCSNSSSKIRLDNNDIYDNPTAIGNCGGTVKTSTTNKTSGTISIPASDVSDSVTF